MTELALEVKYYLSTQVTRGCETNKTSYYKIDITLLKLKDSFGPC